MYSTREKLIHFNQLVNPQAVEADLALLHEKNPQSTDFVRFDHAPEKNSEDILFALLDVCEHDEIVRNRREFFATENKDTDSNSGGEGNGTPLEGTGTENPTDGEGNGTPSEDTGTENPTDGEGNDTPSEDTGAETDNVDNSVDNSSEEGKGNQPKKPATPKKEEEYPKIDWENLADADVQMATVLYNDRINTYRKMKQLDELLEKERNAQAVADMAELRIRNLQAFAELQSFNDTGKFLCKHPLLFGRSEIAELMKLLKADPAEFLRQHKNVLDNIKRYRSYIKRTDRKNRRADDRKNLERHLEREKLFKMVLEQQNK